MTQPGFHCQQCGRCCLNLGDAIATCATEADIARWEAAGREDILAWVDPIALGHERVYDLWIDPETGEDVGRCPWLRKVRGAKRYVCRIHDLKPEHCRRYPRSRRHADEAGCPGYRHGGGPVRQAACPAV
jgi:Fe-S-cluster containining protein